VLLTVLIAGAAFWSAWIFEGQLTEMHNDTILNHRAWIGVDRPIELDSIVLDPKDAKANYVVTLRNYGSSVALHVGISAYAVVRAQDIFPRLHTACDEAASTSNGIMAESSGRFLPEQAMGDSLFPSQEEGRHFQNQRIEHPEMDSSKIIYVLGCVVYCDQFRQQRRTRFFHVYFSDGDMSRLRFPVLLYQFGGFNDVE
jgi:hypothetical protein